MKIRKSIFDAIMLQCPLVPPETGGIMGGHGDLITDVFFDTSAGCSEQAIYCPNVEHLNERIAWWDSQGIEFRGIFHSHPTNQLDLSSRDRDYIIKIVSSMPTGIDELFFPIIIPRQNMYVYCARRKASEILIQADCLEKVYSEISSL